MAEALADNVDRCLKHFPGFVSAAFHASSDGLRVVNYARWRSAADWEAFQRTDDEGQAERDAILARCGARPVGVRSYRLVRDIRQA